MPHCRRRRRPPQHVLPVGTPHPHQLIPHRRDLILHLLLLLLLLPIIIINRRLPPYNLRLLELVFVCRTLPKIALDISVDRRSGLAGEVGEEAFEGGLGVALGGGRAFGFGVFLADPGHEFGVVVGGWMLVGWLEGGGWRRSFAWFCCWMLCVLFYC